MSNSALKTFAAFGLTLALVSPALCRSDRSDDENRVNRAASVFRDITAMPDRGIPNNLLSRAQCIGIVPGQKKFAVGIGGQYGKGVVTCRTAHGWSAPLFITIGGGSWGLQLGGASTDVVMVFLNRDGVQQLLSNKFRVGADANAAAGPVGRSATADTDVALRAQILTYSRSRGAFAGVSLNGSVVQPDDSGNTAAYGASARPNDILSGSVASPPWAQPLITVISGAAGNSSSSQSSTTPSTANLAGSPTDQSNPSSSATQTSTTDQSAQSTTGQSTTPNPATPPPDTQNSAPPDNSGQSSTGTSQPAGTAPSTTTPDNSAPATPGQPPQQASPDNQQPPSSAQNSTQQPGTTGQQPDQNGQQPAGTSNPNQTPQPPRL